MKTKGRVNILKLIVLLIAIVIIASSLTRIAYLTYQKTIIYDIKEVDAKFIVGNRLGFSGDSDVLNFGIVPVGGSSTKEIVLYHEYKEPLKIKIEYTGDMAKVLRPIEVFYLEPNVERKIDIIAFAKTDEQEEYLGTVKVYFIKT